MSSTLTKSESHEVARPLKMLVPLIKSDLEKGDEAGMPYFIAAGEKLNEARDGHYKGNTSGFFSWAEETFGKKREQIRLYMASAAARNGKSFKSLKHFRREGLGHTPEPMGPRTRIFREWTAPVDAIADKAREEQRRLALAEDLTRKQEREAESKLGLRLISIGYRVLAQEFHTDKGGSREAMTRLNRVRDRLKASV
jgi:hypothetical protein